MIIRCPHCGAGHAVRYHPGHNPGTQRCPACGQTFPFFPALEIELAGQPRHTSVAEGAPAAQPQGASRTGSVDRPIVAARGAHGRSVGMALWAQIPRNQDWPLRLAGFLAGLALIATLIGQFLVHERAALAAHPELAGISDLLCQHLRCPGPGRRVPSAIGVDSLQLERHAQGWLRVEMHVTNHLPRPQPWPLLEMVLSDRFGQTLSRGRWPPSEYLGLPHLTPGAIHMLEPGETRRLRLVIDTPEGGVEGIAVWVR
jgi:predicted Zn finger-like uncharacterized protein